MNNKKFTKKKLIDLLVKKATGFYYEEEQFEYENKSSSNAKNDIKVDAEKNNSKKYVTLSGNIDTSGGKIELLDKSTNSSKSKNDSMVLLKKKVTTHYIPPDMIAIKILFDIFDKKDHKDDIEKLNDDELLNLKNRLLEELNNEVK